MTRLLLDGRTVRVVIRSVGITAASGIDARRTADAMKPSLERALARLRGDAPPERRSRQPVADRIAARITDVVTARLRGMS